MCVLILTLVNLHAQTERKSFSEEREEIINKTWMKIGPFRIYPLIKFRDIGYDSNVYYQSENPVEDYTGTFSPDINFYLLLGRRIIFSVLENPEYVYYLNEERYRSFNNTFQTQLKFSLSRFVLFGQYRYANVKTRTSSEFEYRVRHIENDYLAGISFETPRRTSLEIEALRRKIAYKEEVYKGEFYLPRILNRREDSLSLTFYYRLFTQTFFFLRSTYTQYIFDFEESRWRNSDSYSINAGIIFPEIGILRGRLNLGYKKLWRRDLKEKKFEGLIGDTELTLKIYRFLFRGSYLRDCFFTYYPSNFYFIEDRYGGGISFYLSRNIRLDYNYIIGYLNYSEPFRKISAQGIEEVYEERKIIFQNVGIVFRLIKNIGFGVTVNIIEWKSNIYKDMERTFIGGFLTYEF
jgi:hypothetical protein